MSDFGGIGCSFDETRLITTGLVDAAAFHNNADSTGFRPSSDQVDGLRRLGLHGLVLQKGQGELAPWFLTAEGTARIVRCSSASKPQAVFQVRDDPIPLTDRSTYELLVKLEQDGWTWRPWVPPSGRTRRNEDSFQPYRRGHEKNWFSGKAVSRSYVTVLVQSEALLESGLPEIPHGLSEVDYKRILSGNFSLQTRALRDVDDGLPPDIEPVPEPAPAVAPPSAAVPAVPQVRPAPPAPSQGAEELHEGDSAAARMCQVCPLTYSFKLVMLGYPRLDRAAHR
jgi:hypothetical protein